LKCAFSACAWPIDYCVIVYIIPQFPAGVKSGCGPPSRHWVQARSPTLLFPAGRVEQPGLRAWIPSVQGTALVANAGPRLRPADGTGKARTPLATSSLARVASRPSAVLGDIRTSSATRPLSSEPGRFPMGSSSELTLRTAPRDDDLIQRPLRHVMHLLLVAPVLDIAIGAHRIDDHCLLRSAESQDQEDL